MDVQGTKTSLGSSNATLWSTGDQIKVFSGTSDATGSVMTLSSAAGTSNGEFALATGSPAVTTSAPYYGFYPYTTTVSPSIQAIDGTAVFYATMGNQTYVANSFGNNAVPMIAKASANSTLLAFKHVYGLLKLQLKGTGTGPEVRVYQIRVHPLPVKN